MTQHERATGPALRTLIDDGALAGEWQLDPARSTVSLQSKSMGIRVRGVFRQVTAEGTISPAGEVRGTMTIATASIDTKNKRRDTHLRSADFFDSDNYPDITFAADSIRPSGQGATVTVSGALSIRDQTRPMTFDATAAVQGNGEVWLDAQVPINRVDFGLTWNWMGLMSVDNVLTVHAVFTRP
jgi:polyisoprenoid-binding protein YceI